MTSNAAPIHMTIFVVDVEAFGDQQRTDADRVVVHEEMYRVLEETFRACEIPWKDCHSEDRGDGALILVPASVSKNDFVETFPHRLADALARYNEGHDARKRMRLRAALHGGEIIKASRGIVADAVNFTFRLVESPDLKDALRNSPGKLALIVSPYFYTQVVRHSIRANSALYRKVHVSMKETDTDAWIYLPDSPGEPVPSVDDPDTCPYVGLPAFEIEQAKWFFGRTRATSDLVNTMRECLGRGPAILVGASGAGKSSLVRAGLLPALRMGVVPELDLRQWHQVTLTPTVDPCRELAVNLAPLTDADIEVLGQRLVADPVCLVDMLWQMGNARAVIVVDQFEELFTLCSDEVNRHAFVRALSAMSTSTGGRPPAALVLLSIRADFYGHCFGYEDLARILTANQFPLPNMSVNELRQAVEEPAKVARLELQVGLVDVLLRDLGTDNGSTNRLPLLSHALLATWQQRSGHRLTLDGYEATGGIAGAVAHTAEKKYQQFEPFGQRLARQLLLRLIKFGDGADDTRCRVDLAQVVEETGEPQAAKAVLEELAQARLVTLTETRAEITHEVLLRAWPRLHKWIEQDRAGQILRQQLMDAAEAWNNDERHPAMLYRGPRLAAVREWVSSNGPSVHDLSQLAYDFLDAAVRQEKTEECETRRNTRRLHQLLAGVSVLLVLAVTAMVVAVDSSRTSREQRNNAVSQRVGVEVDALRATNPGLAAQLALGAYRVAPTKEARSALLSTFMTPYATTIHGLNLVKSIAFSPDGRTMAAGSADRSVRLWDVSDRHDPKLLSVMNYHGDVVAAVAFSPDGRALVSGGDDGKIRLWDTTDARLPRQLAAFTIHDGHVTALAFSPDGRWLAAGGSQTVQLWTVTDAHQPSRRAMLTGHTAEVAGLAFSPDGRLLASAGHDRTVRLWDVADLDQLKTAAILTDHTDKISAVAFTPDGRTLASSSWDHTVRLWDITVSSPRSIITIGDHAGIVGAIAISGDGHTLATASFDRTVRLWDITNISKPGHVATLTGHGDIVPAVAFTPDGRTLASGSWDYTARLWDLPGPAWTTHASTVQSVAVSAGGHVMASGADDGTVLLQDIDSPRSPVDLAVVTGHAGAVMSIAFSPNGHIMATASLDKTVRLWDVRDPRHPTHLSTLAGHADGILQAAFTPDGRTIATGGRDGTAKLWDVTNLRQPTGLATLTDHKSAITALAFSPDGATMVVGGDDRFVGFWKVADRHQPERVSVALDAVTAVAFSPDSRLMATGSNPRRARLWDVSNPAKPESLVFLDGHVDDVKSVAFSPDSTTLVTASWDRTLRLWDITDHRRPTNVAVLSGHTGPITATAYGSGGHTLVSGSQDRTARLWETDIERVAAEVCAVVTPKITLKEWEEHFADVPFTQPCPR
jgi:WD40 repeat protein